MCKYKLKQITLVYSIHIYCFMANHCKKIQQPQNLVEDHNTYVGYQILNTITSYHNY